MRADRPQRLTIGKLGRIRFAPGYYAYVGTAFGPGGLRARLSHHARAARAPHWHMDYLRPHTETAEIWYTTDRHCREHQWAAALASHRRVSLPAPGFGAGDCSCSTHLFHFENKPSGSHFRRNLRRRFPGHGPIHICAQAGGRGRMPTGVATGRNLHYSNGYQPACGNERRPPEK